MYGDYTDNMEGQTGYVLRSVDNGRSWSDPELVLAPRRYRGGTHTSLGMQTLSDGRIVLPWTHGPNRKKHPYSNTRFLCLISDDHGRNWRGWDERDIGMDQISPYGKIIELEDGSLLCPGWTRRLAGSEPRESSGLIRSQDRGESWGEWTVISTERKPSETDLTLLPDGRIIALVRTYGYEQIHGPILHWTDYSCSDDGGRTWTPPKATNVLGQNLNSWITPRGTLVGACRGIDGTSRLREEEIEPDDTRNTEQKGYGIHFFISDNSGLEWAYQFTLPDPAGRRYTAWHESGEPSFCSLPGDRILVVYYSYDESIAETLDERGLPPFPASELKRIPHVFKRRICACILKET